MEKIIRIASIGCGLTPEAGRRVAYAVKKAVTANGYYKKLGKVTVKTDKGRVSEIAVKAGSDIACDRNAFTYSDDGITIKIGGDEWGGKTRPAGL